MDFGKEPFRISTGTDGEYAVSPEMAGVAEEIGIPPTFSTAQYIVMVARAAAAGYILVEDPALAYDLERGADLEATVKKGQ